ncbi:MAG: hypothetical protein JXB62_17880 [Pirellulales bacterium]|nr:hypothetical protein [Pirellulales bacterium]
MDRSFRRHGCPAAVLVVLVGLVSAAGGCRSALFTATYLFKGNAADAEFDELKGKKVAVVCRPTGSLTYRDANVATDLAEEISRLLKANVSKIEIVDPQEVTEWLDEHGDWTDFAEIGQAEAVAADMVVGIDLHSFTIYQSQVLYQGKANVTLCVCDCREDGDIVFRKELPQSVYPPNAVIPTSEKQEREFRREFVQILADQIGRHFYPHDRHADYALDATALD